MKCCFKGNRPIKFLKCFDVKLKFTVLLPIRLCLSHVFNSALNNVSDTGTYSLDTDMDPDPGPAFYSEYRTGSGSRVLMTKN
jgi:hypothetical protein